MLAVCALALSRAEAALIRFYDTAETNAAVVRLGDVAEIVDADPETAAQLAAVTLIPAPAPGRSVRLDFETIRGRLASRGFPLSHLEFSGSSMVKVTALKGREGAAAALPPPSDLAHERAEQLVARAVQRYLRDAAPELGEVAVELSLTDDQVSQLTLASSARLDVSGGKAPFTADQKLRIGLFDRSGRRHELEVECRAQPMPKVLTARVNLPRGHVIRKGDLAWKQLDGKEPAVAYLDRIELVVGQETRKSLRAGAPIAAADVRGVPLIRRGDIVSVYARSHGIEVRMEAKSQEDGALGEPVRLVSLDGRREISARVAGFHEAIVSGADDEPVPGTGTGIKLLSDDRKLQ